MKGIWVNISNSDRAIVTFRENIGVNTITESIYCGKYNISTVYQKFSFPDNIIHEKDGYTIIANGWLFYKNKLGNINDILDDWISGSIDEFKGHFADNVIGQFFLVIINPKGQLFTITDAFGLCEHFHSYDSEIIKIAPAPIYLKDDNTLLNKENYQIATHLLGSLYEIFNCETIWKGIKKLSVSSIFNHNSKEQFLWYNHKIDNNINSTSYQDGKKILQLFSGQNNILPLSGGSDSRFILACAENISLNAYTVGPHTSLENKYAQVFKSKCYSYQQFRASEIPVSKHIVKQGYEVVAGLKDESRINFYPYFKFIFDQYGEGFLLDGFMGDVINRLTPMYAGKKGILRRIIPELYSIDLKDEMRTKFPFLKDSAIKQIINSSEKELNISKNTPPHIAYILLIVLLHKGIKVQRQFFEPVGFFCLPTIIRHAMNQSFSELIGLKFITNMWKDVPIEYKQVKMTNGFNPNIHYFFSRFSTLWLSYKVKYALNQDSKDFAVLHQKINQR